MNIKKGPEKEVSQSFGHKEVRIMASGKLVHLTAKMVCVREENKYLNT